MSGTNDPTCLLVCRRVAPAARDRIVGKKGRVAEQTLKEDDPEGPPVGLLAVAALLEHLGRNVYGKKRSQRGRLSASPAVPTSSLTVGRPDS